LNLVAYPFSYMFRAPAMLMPHESTVDHEQTFINDQEAKVQLIQRKKQEFISQRAESRLPNLFAQEPHKESYTHELDDEEEDTSSSSN